VSDESYTFRPAPTPRYRNTIRTATEIALEMGHSHIGVEHLFLAIIRDPDAIPTGQLAAFADVPDIESKLLDVINSPEYNTTSPDLPEA
jgi:ATP-dependent Clp protease ATP-binding subunit ClpA